MVENHMATLECMDNYAAPWNNEPDNYKSEDKQIDDGTEDGPENTLPGPNEIGGIAKGDPSKANKAPSSSVNVDEDASDEFSSGTGEEDSALFANRDNYQLEGP